jgi:hypothetical protein
LYGTELQKYKANELFDSLTDNGDPFPLLAQMVPDEANLPFRACIGDMGTEYCKYHADTEPFCATLKQCVKEDMEPKTCRPSVCPFENNRGCVVCSACLQKDVIDEYKKLYTSSKTTASAGSSSTSSRATSASGSAAGTASGSPGASYAQVASKGTGTEAVTDTEGNSGIAQEDLLATFKKMADTLAA